mgnify:CR=1 FL=1
MEDGNGVTTVYRDQIGNDFVITFVPSIDASGVVSGFSQIVVDGQAANGHVVPNIVFASVPDFINASCLKNTTLNQSPNQKQYN